MNYLLWLLITTQYNEDDIELNLEMDDIEMEVEVDEDLTYVLEDHFDHQSEGTISYTN